MQYVLNNTVHRATNATLCQLLLGYTRNKNDDNLRRCIEFLTEIDKDPIQTRNDLRDSADIANRNEGV